MANVSVYQRATVTINERTYDMGSTTTPDIVVAAGEQVFERQYSIAASTLTIIFSNANLADFDFLYIVSDQDALIGLFANENGADGVSKALGVVELKAGVPFMLAGDNSRIGTSANTETWETNWTADVIDRIELYHTASSSAKVNVFAVT